MINLELTVLIDRPVHDVFAFVTTPANLPRWQSMIREARPAASGPLAVGSTIAITGEMLGRKLEGTLQVTELAPDRLFAYTGQSGPMSVRAAIAFETVDAGTRLALTARGDPAGAFKLAESVLAGQLKSQMEANLARLKSVLESSL